MNMESLDSQELEVIGECLEAVVQGPFLVHPQSDNPWWEFPLLMGLEPGEVADIAEF